MRAHEPASFGQENVKAVILLRVLEKKAKNVRHGRNYFCTFYLTSKFAVCRMVVIFENNTTKIVFLLLFSGNAPTLKSSAKNEQPKERFRYIHPDRIELTPALDHQQKQKSCRKEGKFI